MTTPWIYGWTAADHAMNDPTPCCCSIRYPFFSCILLSLCIFMLIFVCLLMPSCLSSFPARVLSLLQHYKCYRDYIFSCCVNNNIRIPGSYIHFVPTIPHPDIWRAFGKLQHAFFVLL